MTEDIKIDKSKGRKETSSQKPKENGSEVGFKYFPIWKPIIGEAPITQLRMCVMKIIQLRTCVMKIILI